MKRILSYVSLFIGIICIAYSAIGLSTAGASTTRTMLLTYTVTGLVGGVFLLIALLDFLLSLFLKYFNRKGKEKNPV